MFKVEVTKNGKTIILETFFSSYNAARRKYDLEIEYMSSDFSLSKAATTKLKPGYEIVMGEV